RVAPRRARGHVSIALVSDAAVRLLNRKYRKHDRVTDVLSFAYDEQLTGRGPAARVHHLGDIVIARGVARRQAHVGRYPELTELRVLALHGLLHLLGYDHEHDDGHMRRVEERLRRRGGLTAGLIARSGTGIRYQTRP